MVEATNTPTVQPTSPPTDPPVAATSVPTDPPTELPTNSPTEIPSPIPLGAITATPLIIPSDTPAPLFTATSTDVPQTAEPVLNTDTSTPIPAPPKPCLSMVGDSVTHGGVTYNIPDTGYIVGLTHPVAEFVSQEFRNRNINTLVAYDRGASNTGINTANHPSYFKSAAYTELLNDHCKFTVIMPWYNDITPSKAIAQADAAPNHVRALIEFIRTLVDRNPGGRIILLNYYQGAVAPFASETWAGGFTPENRDLYNHEIQASCGVGSISRIMQVTCRNTDDAFQGMGTSYVIGMISQDELKKNLVAPLSDLQQGWLDDYFASNPDGLLQGDGIHLSTVGKEALAVFIVNMTQELPDLPMPTE
jgi:lysophospholipase L1-like esterase